MFYISIDIRHGYLQVFLLFIDPHRISWKSFFSSLTLITYLSQLLVSNLTIKAHSLFFLILTLWFTSSISQLHNSSSFDYFLCLILNLGFTSSISSFGLHDQASKTLHSYAQPQPATEPSDWGRSRANCAQRWTNYSWSTRRITKKEESLCTGWTTIGRLALHWSVLCDLFLRG